MDCLELAAQLGQAIAESPEMKTLKEKEAELLSDNKGLEMLEAKRTIQENLINATKSNAPEDEVDKIRDALMDKQAELDEYEVTKAYADAKQVYEKLMSDVNSIVNYYISGGDSGCTGSCETCGGCH